MVFSTFYTTLNLKTRLAGNNWPSLKAQNHPKVLPVSTTARNSWSHHNKLTPKLTIATATTTAAQLLQHKEREQAKAARR